MLPSDVAAGRGEFLGWQASGERAPVDGPRER
jgi:hypothetical protein